MDGYNPFDQQDEHGFSPPPKPPIDIKHTTKIVFRTLVGIFCVCALLILAYSSVYVLESGKVSVITTLGAYAKTEEAPGLKLMLPFIQKRDIVDVSSVMRLEFGYREVDGESTDVPEEGVMLTGDECLVVADWTVQYVISNSYDWLFNVDDPLGTLRIISESAYRRVVASHSLDDILTDKKDQLQSEIMADLQEVCNFYGLGVRIMAVQLQDAMPPQPVYAAFLDVTSAKEDKNAKINEAQKYSNEKLPVARGDAEKYLQAAEAYKQERVNIAIGETSRYKAIEKEYSNLPEVTKTRLYLEMIGDVLPNLKNVYIVDENSGTLQFLPIGKGE